MSQPREEMASESAAMQEALSLLRDRALDKRPVLLVGEAGVGKRRIARWLHQHSPESKLPLVVCQLSDEPEEVCCEALEAKLHQAEEGALYIDEIGDLPPKTQTILVEALQARRLRLIASSSGDLPGLAQAGRFLPELMTMLGDPIKIPSLRDRLEDFNSLLGAFLAEASLPIDAIAPAALESLRRYPWPENVRELKHAVIRALHTNGGVKIKLEHLPPRFHKT